jgi:hypothetical protein
MRWPLPAFTLRAPTTVAPVASASTRMLLVIETMPTGSWDCCFAAEGAFGKTMVPSLQVIKEQLEATASLTT